MKKIKALIALILAITCTVSFCFASDSTVQETKEEFALKDVDTETELGKSIVKLYNAGVVNGIPEADGSFSYTKLTGDVRMYEVDFGYTEEKTVLHDISLYAEPGQKVAKTNYLVYWKCLTAPTV